MNKKYYFDNQIDKNHTYASFVDMFLCCTEPARSDTDVSLCLGWQVQQATTQVNTYAR